MSKGRDQTALTIDGDQTHSPPSGWGRRTAILASLLAGILAITATPALAAGERTTYMEGVRVNFDSQTWSIRGEKIITITLSHCTTNPVHPAGPGAASTHLELRRQTPWYMPDQGHGIRSFGCANTSSQAWTYIIDGTYYFRVNKINNSTSSSTTLDVDYVHIRYE